MNATARTRVRDVRIPAREPATACSRCPVCGSEECLVLEELGTYCATMTAASLSGEAARVEEPAKG